MGKSGEPVEGVVAHREAEGLNTTTVDAVEPLHCHVGLVLLDLNTMD